MNHDTINDDIILWLSSSLLMNKMSESYFITFFDVNGIQNDLNLFYDIISIF